MSGPKPRRTLLLLLLPVIAVLVVAALAWQEAGAASERELGRRGEALLAVVESTVREAGRELALVEQRETARLLAVARRIAADIRSLREPLGPVLRDIAAQEQVGRIFLLDGKGRRVARVIHPEPLRLGDDPMGDVEAIEWNHAEERMLAVGAEPGAWGSEGVISNVFGTRERLGVVMRLRRGGILLVRAEQAAIDRVRSRAGVASVLARLASVPDVHRIELRSAGGAESVAIDGESGARGTATFIGATETPQAGVLEAALTLSRDRLETSVRAQRRGILVWSALAIAASAIGLLVFVRMERAQREVSRRKALEAEGERRLAEMGALAGLFAHEVSNPLNALALELARLQTAVDERGAAGLDRIRGQLATVRETLESYLRLAQSSAGTRAGWYGPADIERTLETLEAETGETVEFEADARSRSVRFPADPGVFDQALRNLLRNALDASRSTVRIAWRWTGDRLHIDVEDDGAGYPAQIIESQGRLGQTMRPSGHGLGLALARRLVENQGSKLELGGSELGGARATIVVPLTPESGRLDA